MQIISVRQFFKQNRFYSENKGLKLKIGKRYQNSFFIKSFSRFKILFLNKIKNTERIFPYTLFSKNTKFENLFSYFL